MAKYKINPDKTNYTQLSAMAQKKEVKENGFHGRNLYYRWNMTQASRDQKLKSSEIFEPRQQGSWEYKMPNAYRQIYILLQKVMERHELWTTRLEL